MPVNLAGRARLKTPWDFFKSIFKSYRPDNARMLDQCFEIDWETTKCEKLIKDANQIALVKDYMKKQYKGIREAYKYYAGLSPLGKIMCIGPGTLTELLSKCENFVDGKTIKISDIDLSLIACNGGKRVTNYLSPDKALVRGQMLEALLRLSIDKYLKTKVTKTIAEAVEMSFETHFNPFFKKFECHTFRKEKLWKEEVDIVFSRF